MLLFCWSLRWENIHRRFSSECSIQFENLQRWGEKRFVCQNTFRRPVWNNHLPMQLSLTETIFVIKWPWRSTDKMLNTSFHQHSKRNLFCIWEFKGSQLHQIQPNWDFINLFLKFEILLIIPPSSSWVIFDNLPPVTTAVQGAEPETIEDAGVVPMIAVVHTHYCRNHDFPFL